jgi:acyl-CoA thioesterase-2
VTTVAADSVPAISCNDPAVDFGAMMRLEPHGPDTYVGVGPRYPWGGLYGGQIVAQALRAAAHTVDERFRVHSLHAYFIRRGDDTEPIRFEVDRTRNGRSFATRRVEARQSVGAILTMAASFQVAEPGPDVQIAKLPDVADPSALVDESWSPMFQRRFTQERGSDEGRGVAWLRMTDDIGDNALLQACALAYLSDDLPTDAVVALLPGGPKSIEDAELDQPGFMSASLDHAIWFHRPLRADEWHLHDLRSHGFLSSRGLSIGHVLTTDGAHVATVAQEVVLRTPR